MRFFYLIMNFKNRSSKHFVYALIKEGKPIYVGCCLNVKTREQAHRRGKTFDYLFVIKEYHNKEIALNAENAIIRFLSILQDKNILNGLFHPIILEKELFDLKIKQNG